jgi:hypothetical protein
LGVTAALDASFFDAPGFAGEGTVVVRFVEIEFFLTAMTKHYTTHAPDSINTSLKDLLHRHPRLSIQTVLG